MRRYSGLPRALIGDLGDLGLARVWLRELLYLLLMRMRCRRLRTSNSIQKRPTPQSRMDRILLA